MGQWIRLYSTIAEVLKNNGNINIDDLTKKLIEIDPRRFNGDRVVETVVDTLASCLVIEGNRVRYDRNSKKYSRFTMFERSIQEALHGSIKNMNELELYPYKVRSNSEKCYIGIPWKEIPDYDHDKEENRCDFRTKGEDSCCAGCGVKEDILKKYNLI